MDLALARPERATAAMRQRQLYEEQYAVFARQAIQLCGVFLIHLRLSDRAGDRVTIRYDRAYLTPNRRRLVRPVAGAVTAASHTRICHR